MNKEITELLEIRQKSKEKKPIFIRQDNNRRIRIGNQNRWRKPKGIHSKIRHRFKGRRKMPSPGYKSPLQVKGLSSTGLKITRVFSVNDIIKMNMEREAAVISRTVGLRTRIEMLKKAKELNISVLNFNLDNKIKEIEKLISSKKYRDTKKEQKQTEIKQKEAQKEQKLTEKEKKDIEKKDKDKLLTKKV